ncbi:Zinc finger AN1 and C2H2 domain-containing stress-associated protein 11 [Striga hermonthica]|uniref:Zinc finger AN1 and C2H2 domain-containing stress-associated protein 11 n=1 Tax=Striga hermonthica TaxID=68872 RepID=A0A9N7R574_STRHE|nr:Zinc finger AN1 and C2H2 domain-containing stress-associated protein 11 [Striga hermonthica]
MGTPAFPNLGKHCTVEDCRQIDFLPFTCDCCKQVYCLDHRSYSRHNCPKANKNDITVVICPLCAKGVRLIPEEDPNITWESHVNTECDPSNYEQATKKRKCPMPRCREMLTFSNTIKCRDCGLDHCLKHRFGPDHNCPGPKKPEPTFQFMNFLNKSSRKDEPNKKAGSATSSSSSSNWASGLWKVASSVRASAEAGIEKLSSEFNQAVSTNGGAQGSTQAARVGSSSGGQQEVCPQCRMRFKNVGALVEHVERVHERNGVMKVTLDVCPKCSKGFKDPVALVEHVEREHRGVSRA